MKDAAFTREFEPGHEEINRHLGERLLNSARASTSARDLILYAKENPPQPIIAGLLNVGDTLLLHGTEESYKSVFILQIAESLTTGHHLSRTWRVCGKWRAGIVETEMHPAAIGERLGKMFPDDNAPDSMLFFDEERMRTWRTCDFEDKFRIISQWVEQQRIDVLLVDTANDFFRGDDNPSEERAVGKFFDHMRNLKVRARILVRHNRKKKEVDGEVHSNELIRGSAEWKEDPEAILYLQRLDKRTNQVHLEVGKLRYGRKPEPVELWFDASCFRLTPLPPVIAVLESGQKTRQELIRECQERFGIEQRLADTMINGQRDFLQESAQGHNRIFEIDQRLALEAPWAEFLTSPST